MLSFAKSPMEGDHLYGVAPEEVLALAGNTIGVVPTLGVTFTLSSTNCKSRSPRRCPEQTEAETGLDIRCMSDGASGAFIAPFDPGTN
ncbi:hypothetical protein O9993_06875 [Vibrio lentus]|nr:hypothetical protein [Vibrio lentus]